MGLILHHRLRPYQFTDLKSQFFHRACRPFLFLMEIDHDLLWQVCLEALKSKLHDAPAFGSEGDYSYWLLVKITRSLLVVSLCCLLVFSELTASHAFDTLQVQIRHFQFATRPLSLLQIGMLPHCLVNESVHSIRQRNWSFPVPKHNSCLGYNSTKIEFRGIQNVCPLFYHFLR